MPRHQLKRGLHQNLPTSDMLVGEPLVTVDRGNLHIAVGTTERKPVTPAVDMLETLPAIQEAEDFLMIHDGSETAGQKEKKMTVGQFKVALNIPEGSSDEKVAVVAGGTSGYIFGTDGTDGVIRLNSSLSWAKDPSNEFVTLRVEVVDGGTF